MTRGIKHVVPEKKSKYRAVKTEVDGIKFDSKKEAKRYGELKMMEKAGLVSELACQVGLPLEVNGKRVAVYQADFFYYDEWGAKVYEDVKGFKTPVYNLKKRLVKAIYGIEIREV